MPECTCQIDDATGELAERCAEAERLWDDLESACWRYRELSEEDAVEQPRRAYERHLIAAARRAEVGRMPGG